MSAPHGFLRACRSAGTLAPTLVMYAATALALLASSTFSTPELSAHCSRLAPSPPPPALAAAPARASEAPRAGMEPRTLARPWLSDPRANGLARGPNICFTSSFERFEQTANNGSKLFLNYKNLHKILSF